MKVLVRYIALTLGLLMGGLHLGAQTYTPPKVRLTQDAPAWRSGVSGKTQNKISLYIQRDNIVEALHGPILSVLSFDNTNHASVYVIFNGNEYAIPALFVEPLSSQEQVPAQLITNVSNPQRKIWVVSYYLDVLASKNREQLRKYLNKWIESEHYPKNAGIEEYGPWWDAPSRFVTESMYIFPACVSLGTITPYNFWIQNVKTEGTTVTLTVTGDKQFFKDQEWDKQYPDMVSLFPKNPSFPLYTQRPVFDLILVPDGDYMDVYLDNLQTKLASYAQVEPVFMSELEKLIDENTYDLSKIVFWPRRANGAMDFAAPKGAKISYGALDKTSVRLYTTTSNLRLRDKGSTAGKVILTLAQGSSVEILARGANATIDNITAPWVRVKTADGKIGWCFGGYLDPQP